ncbi:MAG: ATP-binding protein, partial [Anaerolineales bacterium]
IHASSEKDSITGGSAFNIKAVSWRMGDFIQEEASALLQQHTAETGQVFEPAALEMVWELSQGQPWLTNALAYEVCFRMKAGRDRAQPITAEQVANAKEALILRRETHLDQLADKLKEPRVRRVVEPLLSGTPQPRKLPQDDVEYVADLGLITTRGQLRIANPIYQEVIPRTLIYTTQLTISHQPAWYTTPNGQLDMFKLLTAFQEFFREHSEHWVERFDYKEAGPQLLMQAFLQRIVNAGGRVEREYGLGRGRTDLLVIWQHGERVQKTAIELKILHKSLKKTISEGLKQTWDYMDRAGTPAGHLIIFDRTPDKPWGEKIFVRKETYQGQEITVWGM